MKLTTLLSTTLQLLTITPALAYLEVTGAISIYGNLDLALSIDNGLTTCSSRWGSRIDQDGHFSLTCLSGYVYAFTQDGTMAWYANPVEAFSFTQQVDGELAEWSWDQKQFGCKTASGMRV
jgi:hypothetical protein